ncbi:MULTISPECIES: hypothetical protein [unclassified Gemella]|uniref:hypothetical protein n=1 Tax=unclassified Gemella TaxID=2624949 RepID=UPI001C05EC40|nr:MULTISPECIES: hypothetical protein [unclassified Gemella]MBU0278693.1 hypothetical protein [Gemella sp. zg-1178]QWQ39245.1 hypothetical protein KMP11_02665 [Gemella sp. zg-570]
MTKTTKFTKFLTAALAVSLFTSPMVTHTTYAKSKIRSSVSVYNNIIYVSFSEPFYQNEYPNEYPKADNFIKKVDDYIKSKDFASQGITFKYYETADFLESGEEFRWVGKTIMYTLKDNENAEEVKARLTAIANEILAATSEAGNSASDSNNDNNANSENNVNSLKPENNVGNTKKDNNLKIKDEKFVKKDGAWIYNKADGSMAKGWLFDKEYKSWFFFGENGRMAENTWILSNGSWFYLKSGGYMVQNEWVFSNGSWFYLIQGGYMAQNAWIQDANGNWFYLKSGGYMAQNEWVKHTDGNWYYLKSGGYMAVNEYTPDGYFVDASGVWVR